MTSRPSRIHQVFSYFGVFLAPFVLVAAAGAAPAPTIVVSSATFEPNLAPQSIATVFGSDLASDHITAVLEADGSLPKQLGGVSIEIDGRAAGLLFVSPSQINFYIDGEVQPGQSLFVVKRDGESGSVSGVISPVAPGIYTLPCLRTDRGAALNGVTYSLEPFSASTAENPGDDKATRLSLFASGIRGGVDSLAVEVVDRTGRVIELEVEYAGPAPAFVGLDQINVVLPASLEGAGLLRLRIRVDEAASNFVSVLVSDSLAPAVGAESSLVVLNVAGNGLNESAGDGLSALGASLRRPAAIVFDRRGNLYVADVLAHTVRKVAPNGVISAFAGSGAPGDDGDGGPAAQARLTSPVALAVSPAGDVFIADADARRVRRVSPDGVIHAFAGTGAEGDEGDGGPALQASFRRPSGLAVNRYGSVYISDADAHRVRKVYGDGMIWTFAGDGTAGFSGDGDAAYLAQLNGPGALSFGVDGALFIADNGNRRVRQVVLNGTIRTVAGDGEQGDPGDGVVATTNPFGASAAIEADSAGRICISDGENHRVRVLDSECRLWNVSGVGAAGFSPQGTQASDASMSAPSSVAVSPTGVVHYADADNHMVRKLDEATASGEVCEQTIRVVAHPSIVMSGETAVIVIVLNCAPGEETVFTLSTDDPRLILPPSVVAPPGQSVLYVDARAPEVDEPVGIGVDVAGDGASGSGTVTVVPAGTAGPRSIAISASSTIGGNPVSAVLTIGAPAPEGGLYVALTTDQPEAHPPAGVVVPEGQLGVEFLINTDPVESPVLVSVTGTSGETSAQGFFTILPNPEDGGDPVEAPLLDLTIDPQTVQGGDPSTGTVTLADPAPAAGVLVRLTTRSPDISIPGQLIIPGGEISATFPIASSVVDSDRNAGIVARSSNTIDKSLRLLAVSGEEPEPAVLGVTLNPTAVEGGDASTGTVTLDGPAPAGGLDVALSSSDPSATVPASIAVPEGATSATFTVDTSSVSSTVVATITATASNSADASLTINPAPPAEATILSVVLDPDTVVGGDPSTGTVTIGAPAPTGGVEISLSSDQGSATVAASVTVAEGATSANFSVSTGSVGTQTTATITATSANSASDALTILPKACVASIDVSVSSILGGDGLAGFITLTAAAGPGGVDVELDSSVLGVEVPATVHVDEGEISAEFSITTNPVASLLTAVITATLDGCSGVQVNIGVNPPCVADLQLDVSTVLGGDSVTATIELTGPAPDGGADVSLISSDSALNVPSTVTVPAGQTSVTVNLSTAPVSVLLGAVLEAVLGDCPGVTANLNIEAPILEALSISPSTFPLLGGATATVTLSGPAPAGGVTIDLDGSETGLISGLLSGVLSIVVPSSVTVDPGETEATFNVNATLSGLLGLLTNQAGEVTATLDGVVKVAGVTVTP